MKSLINLDNVSKVYQTEAGDFLALKNVNLQIDTGEFVAVVGKSGSGKSTLINMLTGIDRPSRGVISVADTKINGLDEGAMAEWRGVNLGIVFQFFQLLPTLTVLENVILPMDFCNIYSFNERPQKALRLLEMVEIGENQAGKLPSQLSGGQQQRVAIARALANNPKIIAADEPTGNLDSKTAELIFELFGKLVEEGKTIMMVTHDRDLAKRVSRTLVISDGEIIEEYLSQTFKGLSEKQLVWVTAQLKRRKYYPGQVILAKGQLVDTLYIVTKGLVEVVITPSSGREFVVTELGKGKYFGEIELIMGGKSMAMVRASDTGAEVVELNKDIFKKLLEDAPAVSKQMTTAAQEHYREHISKEKK